MDTNKKPLEVLSQALKAERDSLRARHLKLKEHGGKLAPMLEELHVLGCQLSYPNSVDVRLIGDKHQLLSLLRILNRYGFKTKKIEKGQNEYYESFVVPDSDLGLWIHFTSTVCRRVKIGTKMVEQDVYEVVCDEQMPYGEQPPAPAPTEDSIPF